MPRRQFLGTEPPPIPGRGVIWYGNTWISAFSHGLFARSIKTKVPFIIYISILLITITIFNKNIYYENFNKVPLARSAAIGPLTRRPQPHDNFPSPPLCAPRSDGASSAPLFSNPASHLHRHKPQTPINIPSQYFKTEPRTSNTRWSRRSSITLTTAGWAFSTIMRRPGSPTFF